MVRTRGALCILTWKCASRHNGVHFLDILTLKCASRHNRVHFFDIWTSKSGPNPSVFNTFDLDMCFEQQRPALFRHLNFRKWSANGVLWTFWLGNVLRTTFFSSLICIFFLNSLSFSSLIFSPASSFFSLFLFCALLTSFLLRSDSSHLCFSICPYCWKFDFKTSFKYILLYYIIFYHIVLYNILQDTSVDKFTIHLAGCMKLLKPKKQTPPGSRWKGQP